MKYKNKFYLEEDKRTLRFIDNDRVDWCVGIKLAEPINGIYSICESSLPDILDILSSYVQGESTNQLFHKVIDIRKMLSKRSMCSMNSIKLDEITEHDAYNADNPRLDFDPNDDNFDSVDDDN